MLAGSWLLNTFDRADAGCLVKRSNERNNDQIVISFIRYFFPPILGFMWGQSSSQGSPEESDLWWCSDFESTAFTPPSAARTPSLTPTKLTSCSGYHTQQCLTKNLASTGQPRAWWLKHTAVRRQAGCNLQELLIQGNTQGVGQRD